MDRVKLGIALKFTPKENQGPMVLASGEGTLAEKIRILATKHGIPVVEDAPLAEALTPIPVGKEIPENLYRAVASVFAFVLTQKSTSE
ncbi:EscU/YscU/HrcU family type III secretion system export apparatus switch protein [Leptospira semungkisensis]|uniref:EscU/YscU/HrcU family type III secretion system export apparatus switch protein n=1 Tax=Leptospira semungkisensis TaxID=2484985 RepID=UPI001AEFE4E9|nr:EscU/YscU/HrcU family type III secretion system export apparatus switch protein [Leptospira semungkisensis]